MSIHYFNRFVNLNKVQKAVSGDDGTVAARGSVPLLMSALFAHRLRSASAELSVIVKKHEHTRSANKNIPY